MGTGGGGNDRVVKPAPVSTKPVQAVAGSKSGNTQKKRVREESDSDGDSGSGSEGDSGSGSDSEVARADVDPFKTRMDNPRRLKQSRG
jgi:hypothetical protein